MSKSDTAWFVDVAVAAIPLAAALSARIFRYDRPWIRGIVVVALSVATGSISTAVLDGVPPIAGLAVGCWVLLSGLIFVISERGNSRGVKSKDE